MGSGACFLCGNSGQFAKNCPNSTDAQKKVPARVYAMTKEDAEANPSVVAGEILISSIPIHALIDSGATHSFASLAFVRKLGKTPEYLNFKYCVTIPSGEALCSDQVLKACPIQIANKDLCIDLIVLDMQDFELILDMDWLSKYHATIDCYKKRVV